MDYKKVTVSWQLNNRNRRYLNLKSLLKDGLKIESPSGKFIINELKLMHSDKSSCDVQDAIATKVYGDIVLNADFGFDKDKSCISIFPKGRDSINRK